MLLKILSYLCVTSEAWPVRHIEGQNKFCPEKRETQMQVKETVH